MSCDVFISNRSDFRLAGVKPFHSVLEWYILSVNIYGLFEVYVPYLLLDECLLSCQCTFNIGIIQGQSKAGCYGYKNATRYFPVHRLRLTLIRGSCKTFCHWVPITSVLRFIKHVFITNLQSIPPLLKHIFVTFLPSREKQINNLLLVSVRDTDK